MRFLFWNTYNNTDINPIICEIVEEQNINTIILAEYKDSVDDLILHLFQKGILMHPYITLGCDRITMLGTNENVFPSRQDTYYTMQIVEKDFLLCAVHLPSRLHADPSTQLMKSHSIAYDIELAEKESGSLESIVVGDFNQNPYDHGCLGATGFHSIPVAAETKRLSRKILGEDRKMFYNPMWNLLGDFQYPPGTYYYKSSQEKTEFWNIFDQVMIRPQLRNRFVDTSLKIITETETTSLVDKNRHPSKKISDHLPIVFEVKENNHEL